ncbi:ATP-binding protein [Sulfurovum sp.]|uniref:ATP-binding protein n=1 Tax=Sulfurovum sp. TaxID=1969726 RepID=UPI00356B0AEF
MKLKTLFIILNGLNLFVLLLVIMVILEYKSAYNNMEKTYINKNLSFLLADELRQSSDDLTRLARTYVITANPRFERQYHEVLAIRNGMHPRPSHYNRIYWDFLAVDGMHESTNLNSEAVPLRTLMRKAGFTAEELDLLSQSQLQSDALVHLEEIAMHAVVGLFEDEQGDYTIKKEPDLTLAREVMHSDAYHQAKVKIMNPLNRFFKLFEERTNLTIEKSKAYLNQVEAFLVITVLFFILLMVTSIGIMLKRIIRPLVALEKSMLGLANNDLNTPIPPLIHNDEVGKMIGAVTVFKENTKKLIISERRIKLLLDSIGEGVFGLDEKGAFSFVNPAACGFLGFTSEELIGADLHKIMYEYGIASSQEQLIGTLQSMGRIQLLRKDKTHFYAEYVATPIIGKNNQLEGSVIVFSDITERKIDEETMRRAKDSAEAANRSKSLFLANMSHELRTPLNAILGFAHLLLKDTHLHNKQKENLETIHNSGKHLLNIINEILEVAKLQAGKIEITNASFDFHGFLNNIVLIFSNRAEAKGLAFKTNDLTPLPQFIIGDEQRLRQVLFNLLSNALKFTEDGSISLHVTFDNNQLSVDIADTGMGIKEDELQLIFKPFEQAKSTQEQKEGTGLGLAITQELVTLMGGKISVTSVLNRGTTFSVKLYIPQSENGAIVQKAESLDRVLIKKHLKKFKVLIVDDIYENRSLLVQMVQYLGFETSEAEDGMMALQQLKDQKPDIILMDIQMPKMDGYQTIEEIRRGTVNPHIPIVLISANVFEEEQQKAREQGANAFIGKPIKEHDIIATLETLLDVQFTSPNDETPSNTSSAEAILHMSAEDKALMLKAARELNTNQMLSILTRYEGGDKSSLDSLRQKINNYQFSEIIAFFTS